MSRERMYIRFGVHKDRDVLKQLRDSFAGVIVPAHILSHSSDATRAAVDYIDRAFFIDPMTYILTSENIKSYVTQNKEKDGIKFKMSIEKMTEEYGLLDYFKARDYKELEPSDFTDKFIEDLCIKNKDFQCSKLNSHAESAYKKYSEILAAVDPESFKAVDHQPIYIVPPYFYSPKVGDAWHKINIKLAQKTQELCNGSQVVAPILLTSADNLVKELLDDYSNFKELILWATDLDETKPTTDDRHIKKLKSLRDFVDLSVEKNVKITNLYGSYYSALLTKRGLKGFSNGIFYGEYKDFRKKIGGGAPPARFYISALHSFYLVPVALAILQDNPKLFDMESQATKILLDDDFTNISRMSLDSVLAQKHFLYAREHEFSRLDTMDAGNARDELEENFKLHGNYGDYIKEGKPLSLLAWHAALSDD